MLFDIFDGRRHLHDPLRSPVSGFHRDDDAVARAQGRETHEGETRRTIKHDVIVLVFQLRDCFDKREVEVGFLPLFLIAEIERRKRRSRRDQVDVRKMGRTDETANVGVAPRMEEYLDAGLMVGRIEEGIAEIALCIGVDEKHPLVPFLADRSKQPGRVRFTDTTFEVEDGDRCRVRGAWIGHAPNAIPTFFRSPATCDLEAEQAALNTKPVSR